MSWSIPCPFFINQLDAPFQEFDELTYNSDPNSRILGKVTPAGTATSWMQQSTRGVQSNFRGGTVPRSAFGYFVGTNQSYKKIITSTSDDVPDNSFRANVCSYDLENCIRTKMVSREQQDMAMLSLQLIILRVCQKLAKNSQSQYSADLPIVLPILFE